MAKIIEFPTIKKPLVNKISASDLAEVPIVRQALFFLSELIATGGIKLTPKGNLGRNFVRSFYDIFVDKELDPFRPNSEDGCLDLQRLRKILEELKYIKKFRQSVVITATGRDAQALGATTEFYQDLFAAGAFVWDWGNGDLYPDFDFMQDGVSALMNTLWEDREPTIDAIALFSKSFVIKGGDIGEVNVAQALRLEKEAEEDFDGPTTKMVNCLQVRFMLRFCVPFGLLRAPRGHGLLADLDVGFAKSDFLLFEAHDILCPLIHAHRDDLI